MKLYTFAFSSNARKAAMAAHMLGVQLTEVVVDLSRGEQRLPGFLALNPNGTVPVLVDGEFVLWESNAIMAYLADRTPGNTLYPTDPQVRADVNKWLFWQANHWSPAISGLTFENMLKKRLGLGEPDAAQVARHEGFVQKYGGVLDGHLKGREWVSGSGVTLADIAIAAPLMYAVPGRLPIEAFANVQRWLGNVQGLDAWKKTEPPQWGATTATTSTVAS